VLGAREHGREGEGIRCREHGAQGTMAVWHCLKGGDGILQGQRSRGRATGSKCLRAMMAGSSPARPGGGAWAGKSGRQGQASWRGHQRTAGRKSGVHG
jgi:hypothetical protein